MWRPRVIHPMQVWDLLGVWAGRLGGEVVGMKWGVEEVNGGTAAIGVATDLLKLSEPD